VDTVWNRAEAAWISKTRHLAEPFRSTDCECQHGQFSNWEKSQCDQLMAELVSVLLDFDLSVYAGMVPIQHFRDVFPDSEEHEPFYLAFATVIINLAMISEQSSVLIKPIWNRLGLSFPDGDLDVLFWFEENQETDGRCNRIYHELKALQNWPERRRIAGRTFADKTCVPLQAADLLAREAFKYADNRGTRHVRKPVLRLRKQITYCSWNRESLEELRDLGGHRNIEAVVKVVVPFSQQEIATPILPGPYL
jgi:hypothetical protein